jgi:predicted alpha/beta-hydrolase family hydrolase
MGKAAAGCCQEHAQCQRLQEGPAAHLVVVQLRLVGGRLQRHLQRPHIVGGRPIGDRAAALVLSRQQINMLALSTYDVHMTTAQ